jgi:hypothetical protein
MPDQVPDASQPGSKTGDSLAERRLREAVEHAEADLRAERKKTEKHAPKLEPLWMLLFHAILLAGLAGLAGAIAKHREKLLALGKPPEDFSERLFYDAHSIIWGLGADIASLWPVVTSLLVASGALAFGIKDVRRRRRYFSLASAVILAVFAYIIGVALMEMMSERGAGPF